MDVLEALKAVVAQYGGTREVGVAAVTRTERQDNRHGTT
jgi:hypothetical protein